MELVPDDTAYPTLSLVDGAASTVLGRKSTAQAPVDVVLGHNQKVSSRHCSIWFEDGKVLLRDEDTANGTFHNAIRLAKGDTVELKPGDTVSFPAVPPAKAGKPPPSSTSMPVYTLQSLPEASDAGSDSRTACSPSGTSAAAPAAAPATADDGGGEIVLKRGKKWGAELETDDSPQLKRKPFDKSTGGVDDEPGSSHGLRRAKFPDPEPAAGDASDGSEAMDMSEPPVVPQRSSSGGGGGSSSTSGVANALADYDAHLSKKHGLEPAVVAPKAFVKEAPQTIEIADSDEDDVQEVDKPPSPQRRRTHRDLPPSGDGTAASPGRKGRAPETYLDPLERLAAKNGERGPRKAPLGAAGSSQDHNQFAEFGFQKQQPAASAGGDDGGGWMMKRRNRAPDDPREQQLKKKKQRGGGGRGNGKVQIDGGRSRRSARQREDDEDDEGDLDGFVVDDDDENEMDSPSPRRPARGKRANGKAQGGPARGGAKPRRGAVEESEEEDEEAYDDDDDDDDESDDDDEVVEVDDEPSRGKARPPRAAASRASSRTATATARGSAKRGGAGRSSRSKAAAPPAAKGRPSRRGTGDKAAPVELESDDDDDDDDDDDESDDDDDDDDDVKPSGGKATSGRKRGRATSGPNGEEESEGAGEEEDEAESSEHSDADDEDPFDDAGAMDDSLSQGFSQSDGYRLSKRDGGDDATVELNKALIRCEQLSAKIKDALHGMSSGAHGAEEHCLNLTKGSGEMLTQPKCMAASTRSMVEYQLVALNWLHVMHGLKLSCILADEMGLGKTVEAISLIAALKDAGSDQQHMVVAPVSVLDNWAREFAAWCPGLRARKYYGPQETRIGMQNTLDDEGFDVLITSYSYFEGDSLAQQKDRKWLCGRKWGVVVFDEAHALKRTDSSRFSRLSKLETTQRLLMTGTPVQNSIGEVVALLTFMLPDVFTPMVHDAFVDTSGARGGRAQATEAQVRRVRRLLAPFILRRTKREVLQQLVSKTEEEKMLEMTSSQQQIYSALISGASLKQNAQPQPGGKAAARKPSTPTQAKLKLSQQDARSLFTDLRKSANHPLLLRRLYTDAQLDAIAKAATACETFGRGARLAMVREELVKSSDFVLHQLCEDLGEEVPSIGKMRLTGKELFDSAKMRELRALLPRLHREGHRVLLFSQYTTMLDLLEAMMGAEYGGLGLKYVRLDGQTKQEHRQELIDEFQAADSDLFAFLLSTRAGGQGINLTAADTVILHDLDWNPQLDRQAEDRAHRMGQTREVRVIRMVTRGTVDENIYAIQKRKKMLDEKLLKGDDKAGGKAKKAAAAAAEEEGRKLRARPENYKEGEGEPDFSMISSIILEQLAAQQGGGDA